MITIPSPTTKTAILSITAEIDGKWHLTNNETEGALATDREIVCAVLNRNAAFVGRLSNSSSARIYGSMSAFDTFETCGRTLNVSAYCDRSEVTGALPK